MISAPQHGLPAASEVDLHSFWRRFDATAPLHLRLGLRAMTVALAALAPIVVGRTAPLHRLTADELDHLLQRAAALPCFGELVDVLKIVASLAYFDVPEVQSAVRGQR